MFESYVNRIVMTFHMIKKYAVQFNVAFILLVSIVFTLVVKAFNSKVFFVHFLLLSIFVNVLPGGNGLQSQWIKEIEQSNVSIKNDYCYFAAVHTQKPAEPCN